MHSLLFVVLGLGLAAAQEPGPSSQNDSTASQEPAPLSCPASANMTYTASSGAEYVIECDTDHEGGDIGSISVTSLEKCIAVCDLSSACVDVVMSGSACYLKGIVGRAITGSRLRGARLVTPAPTSAGAQQATATAVSCPASNNTIYTSDSGANFTIECSIDHAGGDMAAVTANNLTSCIESCANTTGCVYVSFLGSSCYLKSNVCLAIDNPNIQGARAILPASSTTSTSTTPLPTATALSCPGSDNATYYAPSGDAYIIECSTDRPGGDMGSSKALSLEECIATCDLDINCGDVTLSGVGCYEKSVLNAAVAAPGMLGARLAGAALPVTTITTAAAVTTTTGVATGEESAVACPASNGTIYTTGGQRFVIECNTDHAGGDLAAIQLSGAHSTWFTQCIEVCANTTGCVDVSLAGSGCYLKDRLTRTSTVQGISGARLLAPPAAPAPTPIAPARVGSFEYLACYNDSVTSRVLSDAYMCGSTTNNMTIKTCSQFCANSTYFGVEYADECYCGNVLASSAVQQDPSECEFACPGKTSESCGGDGRISVYQLVGNWNATVGNETAVKKRWATWRSTGLRRHSSKK